MRGLLLQPRAWLLVLIPIAVSLASLPARAQDAAAFDKKARDAFERKDFAGAAQAFEDAYGFRPHPATKYNAAFAWEKAGEKARAADAYEAALNSDGLDAKRSEAARSRLSVLKPQLAYVIVERPIGGTVTVEHVKDVPIPARIHLEPGSHTVVVRRSNGKSIEQALSLKAGSTTPVVIEDDNSPALDAPAPEKKPVPKKEAPPPTKDEGTCSSCTWGWVAIGGAVAAAGAGAYFGVKTLSANDDFEASDRTDTDAHDRAVSSRTLSNVMFGVAAVAGGVGIYLVLTGKKSKPETSSLVLGVHPHGVSTQLTF